MLIWVTVGGGDIRRSKPRDANDICQGYIRLSQVDRLGSVPLWMHCHDEMIKKASFKAFEMQWLSAYQIPIAEWTWPPLELFHGLESQFSISYIRIVHIHTYMYLYLALSFCLFIYF